MKTLLNTIPIPLSGLMLGVVALAKLLFFMDLDFTANIFFLIGLFFFIILILKMIFALKDTLQQLSNPIVASIAPTFTMGAMVIASIFMYFSAVPMFAEILWIVSVVVHFGLVGYFVWKFIVKTTVTLKSIFPSWFVTFVGIGMIPVTAPAFAKDFAAIILLVAIICFVSLLPFIWKRIFITRDLPIPAKPLIAILAAPASVCALGLLTQFENINNTVLVIFVCVAQVIYFIVLYELQTLIKLPFYPSFGAFTFPLVVSATALYKAQQVLHFTAPWLDILLYFELIIACVIVTYVVVVYVKYLVTQIRKEKAIVG